jgi:hypothetical protein
MREPLGELDAELRLVVGFHRAVERLETLDDLLEGLAALALAGAEDERQAVGLKQGGVQSERRDDGALACPAAAIEQDLSLLAEEGFGLPRVNGEAAGAENRPGVERHGHEAPRVHDRLVLVCGGDEQ